MRKLILLLACILGLGSCSSHEGPTENPLEKLCSNPDISVAVQCLRQQPKEDILAIPAVAAYLKNHKVYLSFTTSPERIGNSFFMLNTLDLEYVENILLAIPEKYRNKIPYGKIPPEIQNFPKMKIIAQDKKDVGPATKILYALSLVGETDPDAIVISLDDEIGLPWGGIGQLIKYAILYPNAVVGGSGRYAGVFGIGPEDWPSDTMTDKAPYCGHGEISYCHVLEGYKGIAYKPRLVNIDETLKALEASVHCLNSDDLVIGYMLAQNNVERIRVSNPQYYQVSPFSFGFQGDALHRIPSQSTYTNGWVPRRSWAGLVGASNTADRYQRCAYDLKIKQNR